jgi:hypothetical protein
VGKNYLRGASAVERSGLFVGARMKPPKGNWRGQVTSRYGCFQSVRCASGDSINSDSLASRYACYRLESSDILSGSPADAVEAISIEPESMISLPGTLASMRTI